MGTKPFLSNANNAKPGIPTGSAIKIRLDAVYHTASLAHSLLIPTAFPEAGSVIWIPFYTSGYLIQ